MSTVICVQLLTLISVAASASAEQLNPAAAPKAITPVGLPLTVTVESTEVPARARLVVPYVQLNA